MKSSSGIFGQKYVAEMNRFKGICESKYSRMDQVKFVEDSL